MVIINPTEPRHVSGIDVVQMDAAAALAHLCICRRPFTRLGQIPFKGLITLFVRNIKVNDDMVLRQLYIVELGGVQLRKLSANSLPFSLRGSFGSCILSRAICAARIKDGRNTFCELNRWLMVSVLRTCSSLLFVRSRFLKLFCPKPVIVAPHTSSILHVESLLVFSEVVSQLFLKYHSRQGIQNLRIVAIGLVHFPSGFQRNTIFSLKHMVRINDKVIEVVRGSEHRDRDVVIVIVRAFQIYFLTVIGDAAELKRNLLGERAILSWRNLIPSRGHVNQSADDA